MRETLASETGSPLLLLREANELFYLRQNRHRSKSDAGFCCERNEIQVIAFENETGRTVLQGFLIAQP